MLLCKNLEQSFESVVAIEPKFVTTETDPNALKITTASDIISLLNVNMKTDFGIRRCVSVFHSYLLKKLWIS